MLASIDIILDAVGDILTVTKAIRATYTVTVNTNQMPIHNQVEIFLLHVSFYSERNFIAGKNTWSNREDPSEIIRASRN